MSNYKHSTVIKSDPGQYIKYDGRIYPLLYTIKKRDRVSSVTFDIRCNPNHRYGDPGAYETMTISGLEDAPFYPTPLELFFLQG